VLLGEEIGRESGIGLRHAVFVDLASHVTGVAWHMLSADVVGGSTDPVGAELAPVSEDIFVHLARNWQIGSVVHGLLQGQTSHVLFNAARFANFFVNGSGGLSEEVVPEGHMASVARQVLAGPLLGLLGHVVGGLGSPIGSWLHTV
jgi:hypothetical protein